MKSQSSVLFILAAGAGLAQSQTFANEASLPGCGETCLDNLISEGTSFGCPQEDASCLCGVAAFTNGVHDCAQNACATDLFSSVTDYMVGLCATATLAATSAAVSATSAVPVTAAVLSSAAAASVYPTSAVVASVASTPDATSALAAATSAPYTASTIQASIYPSTTAIPTAMFPTTNSTISSASSAPLVGIGGSTSGSSSTAASFTFSTSSTASSSASGSNTAAAGSTLSGGAKAGIGIGAAVGVVAVIAAIVAFTLSRKQRSRDRDHTGAYKISDPMPGGDRGFAEDHESGMSELELKSRRYEDMVPRQVPRNMV